MKGSYLIVTDPVEEPVRLEDVKVHLKLDADATDEDLYLGILIKAARQFLEGWLDRAIVTTGYELYLDGFCTPMEVRKGLKEVTAVTYFDGDNVEQTLPADGYTVDSATSIGRIYSVAGWPQVYSKANCIKISFTAGYGTAAEVPAPIKQAILLMIGRLYEQREDTVQKMPTASEYLVQSYRLFV